jgi:hypothetical protein
MLRKILEKFKRTPKMPNSEEILLSKIDRHMNFILRDSMGSINKNITSLINQIQDKKEEAIYALRNLHKAKLMNTNIPEREIQIMEGNRENYIKKISQFVTTITIPKNYLDTHDYCVKTSEQLEQLSHEIQKNIFVLNHFFTNEIKDSNRAIHDLEEKIIEIRVLLEKNGITYLKDIQKNIKLFVDNTLKIKDFKAQIVLEEKEISDYEEKLNRLNERIKTITSGTDYRALEGFKQEKIKAETEIKNILNEINEYFSSIDTALKKYYYKYPEKKITTKYLEDLKTAVTSDIHLEIIDILREIKNLIENNEIDLKDKKKENCIEAINKLKLDYVKNIQSQILKLEDQKQHAQTKITHNSASLNLSEQQYWINATEDKIKHHNNNILKLNKNMDTINLENNIILENIRSELEKIMNKNITLRDDITTSILTGEREFDVVN